MIPVATDYSRAVALLRAGELVAFPAETVDGLGAVAANPEAVANILAPTGGPARKNGKIFIHVLQNF